MTRDLGIIHLTDLHWPARGQPIWSGALIAALRDVGADATLQVAGLAVTGDLVDDPSEPGFINVAEFLERAANLLNLAGTPRNREQRVWVVDGNHDYRRKGTFGKINPAGIELGNRFRRHGFQVDAGLGLLVVGLDSAAHGDLARGSVTQAALQEIEKQIADSADARSARFRVALVHHHLLTIPSQPIDPSSRLQRLKARVFDEGTKLLENSGLLARRLLDMQFDLVLHGHEHQGFAATLSRVDGEGNRTMAILGGTSADKGFAVVRWKADGAVEFQSFGYAEAVYRPAPPATLWTVDDWRRLEWQRTSRENGWYQGYEVTKVLDFSGDAKERVEVTGIYGPRNKSIDEVSVELRSYDLGTAVFDRFVDKQSSRTIHDYPGPATRLAYRFALDPPARQEAPHAGYRLDARVLNSFATISWEADQRGLAGRQEFTTLRAAYPVQRMILRFRFPPGRVPADITVLAYRITGTPALDQAGPETADHAGIPDRAETPDHAETQPARRLLFDSSFDLAILDLEWVLPCYRYELRWRLPEPDPPPSIEADMAERQRSWLLALPGGSRNPLNASVRALRDTVCRERLQQPNSADINLSLLVYDENSRTMRVVCSTYDASNPELGVRLNWGEGVAGLAMRRRHAAFVDARSRRHAGIYHPVAGVPPERYLLCVPVPIPWDSGRRGQTALHPSLPPAVLSMSSMSNPAMGRLNDESQCATIASFLAEAFLVTLDTVTGSGLL